MNIKASLSHGALVVPQYAVLFGIFYTLPMHWALATVCSLMWLTRELAQYFRPSNPLGINITPQFAADFGIPTLAAYLIALGWELM